MAKNKQSIKRVMEKAMFEKRGRGHTSISAGGRLVAARAAVMEMKAAAMAGKYIDAELAKRLLSDFLRQLSQRLCAIPAQLAQRVIACRSPAEAQGMMYAEIEKALNDAADAFDAFEKLRTH